jgi:hypothetical protein
MTHFRMDCSTVPGTPVPESLRESRSQRYCFLETTKRFTSGEWHRAWKELEKEDKIY